MSLKVSLIPFDHLNEIAFMLAHHRGKPIVPLVSSNKQKQFYSFVATNLKYDNVISLTFNDIITDPNQIKDKIAVLMDIPKNFQLLQQILKSCEKSEQIIMLLMKENKKFINMMKKKINGVQITLSQYSKNQLVGINGKLRDLVDKSYDMNRAAFYAYGAYLNNFRENMLKFIFKTQAIDVAALAKSYGFTTPPRVKDGKFLKVSVRKEKVSEKKKEKKLMKKIPVVQQQQEQEQQLASKKPRTKKLSIKQIALLKTKRILKQRAQASKKQKLSKQLQKKQQNNEQAQKRIASQNEQTQKSAQKPRKPSTKKPSKH